MPAPDFSEDYVAELLKKDARNSLTASSSFPLLSNPASSTRSRPKPNPNTPKPNLRFLNTIIRETDTHNSALKLRELEQAGDRLRRLRGDPPRETDARSRQRRGSSSTRSRHQRDSDSADSRRRQRRRSRSRSGESRDRDRHGHRHRHRRDRSRSPRHADRRRNGDRGESGRSMQRGVETSSTDRGRRREDDYESSESESRDHGRGHGHRSSHYRHGKGQRDYDYGRLDSRSAERTTEAESRAKAQLQGSSRERRRDRDHERDQPRGSSLKDSSSPQPRGLAEKGRPAASHHSSENSPQRPGSGLDAKPTATSAPVPIIRRGRGAHSTSSSAMDARFLSTYDPKVDVSPEITYGGDDGHADDWSRALDAVRDRAAWQKAQGDRLRAAGFSEQQVERWEKGGRDGSMEDIEGLIWRAKGQGREWDVGKVVRDDGRIEVEVDMVSDGAK